MKIFTKALALALLSSSIGHVSPLTEAEVTGYTALGGVATGALFGGITFGELYFDHRDISDTKRNVISLVVGGVTGGLASWLLYASLSLYTPKARFARANYIIKTTRHTLLAKDDYATDDELFAIANQYFNVRWPIALAHEACINMRQDLNEAANLLALAAKDTNELKLLRDIERLAPEIDPLLQTLAKHARIFQKHKQYDIQATLLEGFRREQRMEREAAQRHREAMAAQERRHQEAMRQQERLLKGRVN